MNDAMGRQGFLICLAAVILTVFRTGSAIADPATLPPVSCLIEPFETVALSPAAPGIVGRVLVERGDTVRKGDVLVEFDARAEEIALELATARAENRSRLDALIARRDFLDEQAGRAADLASRNAGSFAAASEARMEAEVAARDIDQEKAMLAQAGLERHAAEIVLDQLQIRAPIDGLIIERLLAPGEYRDNQNPVLRLARLDKLRVEAFASISHAGGLRLGQTVHIRPEEPVGGVWPAEITIIDQVFDAATATFGFRMELANPDLALPAGLRCEVEFDVNTDR